MARRSKIFARVEVIDIGDKGNAIGKTEDGRIVLVEEAVPGDIVNAVSKRKRKGMFITTPVEYLEYSPDRTEPFCAHFGVCGGCKWQNLRYDRQAALKEKAVRDSLRRIAHIENPEVLPIITGEHQKFYRNKLEFTFTDYAWLTQEQIDSGEDFDRRGLGFHVPGEFSRVVDIHECHLQPEPSNAVRNFVREFALQREFLFQNIRNRTGLLRNLLVRNNAKGEFLVALIFNKEEENSRVAILDAVAGQFPQIVSLYYAINEKVNDSIYDLEFQLYSGQEKLVEYLGGFKFEIGPKSFFQTNRNQAEVLYSAAAEMASLDGSQVVYDLYCGIGSITLFVAGSARHVVGIEENEAAIDDARANAKINNIDNVDFFAGDAKMVLAEADFARFGSPDVVITDPPRAGMHESVVRSIIQMSPEKIVYVSCNPATQARDIGILSDKYQFVRARPVDMFPHTSHIENVALLIRRS